MGLGSKIKKAVKKVTGGVSGSGLLGALTGGLAGAVVGGPGGALAGAGLGYFSGAGQDAANEANAEAVQAANNANVQLWREQAAYNTPANQVARLRAAGLNPNLFYTQGDSGNMSSAPTMKASQYSYNYAEAVDKAAIFYQMKNLQAQNANLKAQTDNIQAQTRLQNIKAEMDSLTVDYYRKYGYLPNQSTSSRVWQTVQDVLGLNPHSVEAARYRLLGALETNLRDDKALSDSVEGPWWYKNPRYQRARKKSEQDFLNFKPRWKKAE